MWTVPMSLGYLGNLSAKHLVESSLLWLTSTLHLADNYKKYLMLLGKLLYCSHLTEDECYKSWPRQETKYFFR